ncbi:hypothetical protein SteCoe_6110 [Stentor coeruleus]|uniref:EF-hand domain-containing protein n=1 Tax=Stentor coeruleus TaxID=5963 RepID=A0A1R2CQP5_9CILI|nr:hypothetical protein SteCoe_6110 [Stentor coeruleus]
MGCLQSHVELSREDKTIVDMELQLEYSRLQCANVDYVIRRYSENEEINKFQWDSIVAELGIKSKNYKHCPELEAFYNAFTNENQCISKKELLILGILLSSGQIRTKARLIFEIYDPENLKVIDRSCLEDLFEIIKEIAVIRLPMLVNNSTEPLAGQRQIELYTRALNAKSQIAKNKFVKLFSDGKMKISLEEFKAKFDIFENALLLSTFGFRSFLAQF